jgi:AAA-like domain
MAKKFNVTGTCFPEEHYMADVSKKMDATYSMIEEGEYFIINRPRQYGKTTTIYTMMDRLIPANYAVFNISFEGLGDVIFTDEKLFSGGFFRQLGKVAHESVPELKSWLLETALKTDSLEALSDVITELCSKTPKKVVVLIDEVDKSSNNQLFVSFLAMLRNKYLERRRSPTFHSVVLAGVHDVKNLKLKIRPEEAAQYNSPWNIATKFTVDMTLKPAEIKPMLEDYMQERSIKMDTQLIAERLFYLTNGYPYLVSQLCKIIAEEILPTKITQHDTIGTAQEWTEADVNKSFQMLIRERGVTNFDTVIKNLNDYPKLYQLVYSLIIDGLAMPYDDSDSTINLGVLHGILGRSEHGMLIIHNRIYRELIANMMISEWRTNTAIQSGRNTDVFSYISQYHLPNKGLDMQKVLENFQIFMRKEYSGKDKEFLERDGRLIFLAFLRPILNGAGYDFKEPQISDEKRLDVIMTYHQHLYVAELKIWHGAEAHKKGLAQLAAYLDTLSLDTGFLLIFDTNKKKKWEKGWADSEGKRIFWIRV